MPSGVQALNVNLGTSVVSCSVMIRAPTFFNWQSDRESDLAANGNAFEGRPSGEVHIVPSARNHAWTSGRLYSAQVSLNILH